ncbi:MAG: hypothetical protein ACP5HG_12610 [Anaerolineae bacterium]
MGTLACITTGFEVTARHPELIVLPLLLDLFLWLGPRLSVAPILKGIKAFLTQWMAVDVGLPEVTQSYAAAGQILEELSEGYNLFSLLNTGPLLGVPVLTPARMSATSPIGIQPAIEIGSPFVAILGMAVLALVGLGLSAFYLRPIALRVLEETDTPLPGPQPFWQTWVQFLKLGLLLGGVILGFSMLLSFLVTMLGLISFALAGLLMTLAFSIALFILVHLVFTIPGMLQLRREILRAMRESLLLARGDFLNVIFLLGLIFVISQGLNVVWTLPEPDSWATLVGLAGHAFVSTALTAALLVFYQERLRFLEVLKQLYAAQTNEAKVHPILGE